VSTELKGQLVYLTGAGSGIGRTLAFELMKEGCRVLAIDSNAKSQESLKSEKFPPLATLQIDVSDRENYLQALEEASLLYGAPQLFINNAAIAKLGGFSALGLAAFEKVMGVNFMGLLYGSYFALKKMQEAGRGTIVNMASTAGHVPSAFMGSYCASKFAVVGFTRSLRAELQMAKIPVKICLVSPGFIDTAIMRQEGTAFPWYLRWLIGKPEVAAYKIVLALKKGKEEIYPDLGGRLIRRMYRLSPKGTQRFSQLLLTEPPEQLITKTGS
jgi:NAD(P)-dependent dehydrogenase (short-subunit alcohol dehydrogenase family)